MPRAAAAYGFTEKYFDTSSVTLHYGEGPTNGPPLLLLHGMARDWKFFSVLLPDLAPRFHVLALDLRGHGRSGHVLRGYRITDFAQDILDFTQAVTPHGTALFGHSLGAMVGMCAAAQADPKIKALIVGDSMISPENLAASLYGPLFSQIHRLMLQKRSPDELARGIGEIKITFPELDEPLRISELAGNSEEALLEWARTVDQLDPEALAMTLDLSAFVGWEPERLLPRIACPVLLLQANPELDGLLTDADVKRAMRLLPRAEHVRFPLLGHALFKQQAKPVLRVVTDFLGRHVQCPS